MEAVGLLEELSAEVLKGEVSIDDAAKEALTAMLETLTNSEQFIRDAHDAAEELRATEAASVARCKADFTVANTEDDTIGNQVENTHSSHKICRDAYKTLKEDETRKCDAMNSFINGLQPPSCAKPDRAGMDGYFNNWATHVASNQKTWNDLHDACTDAETKARNKDAECDTLQASFESRFCEYRLDVFTTCSTYKGCYAKEKEDFQLAIASTNYAAESRKIEWSAIQKIKCFVNVLIADDDANEDRKSAFDQCQADVPDTSHLDLDDVSIPDEQTCNLSPVVQYPCTEAFTSSRYDGMWSLAECNACAALPSHINVDTGHLCAPVADVAEGWSNTLHKTKDGMTYMGAYSNGQTKVTKTFNLVGGVTYKWSVVFDTWASVDSEAITLKANDQTFSVVSRRHNVCENGWTQYSDNGATGRLLGSTGSGKHDWKDCYKAVENTIKVPSNGIVNIEMSMNINQGISDEGWGFHDMKFDPQDCPVPNKDTHEGWSNPKHAIVDGVTYMGAYSQNEKTTKKTFNLLGGVTYKWSLVFDTWASVDNEAITLKANDQTFSVGSRRHNVCDNGWTEYPDNGATGQKLGSGGSGKHDWKDCYKAVENTITAPSNGVVNVEVSMNINQAISDEAWGFHDMKFSPV